MIKHSFLLDNQNEVESLKVLERSLWVVFLVPQIYVAGGQLHEFDRVLLCEACTGEQALGGGFDPQIVPRAREDLAHVLDGFVRHLRGGEPHRHQAVVHSPALDRVLGLCKSLVLIVQESQDFLKCCQVSEKLDINIACLIVLENLQAMRLSIVVILALLSYIK